MKKFIKVVFITILSLIILFILAAVGIATFVNPNQFKPQIIATVQKETGRTLTINGNLGWTFFPSLGISVKNGLTLSNPAGFSGNFASIKDADISIAVLPLLKKEIQVNNITVNGLTLNLVKQSDAATNWNFGATPAAPTKTSQATSSSTTSLPTLSATIHATNATINFNDAQAGQQASVQLNKMDLHVKNNSSGIDAGLQLKNANILVAEKDKKIAIHNLNADSTFMIDADKNMKDVTIDPSTFSADSVAVNDMTISNFNTAFRMNNGVFDLTKFSADLPGGNINIQKLSANFNEKTPVITLAGSSSGIDVGKLLSAFSKGETQNSLTISNLHFNTQLLLNADKSISIPSTHINASSIDASDATITNAVVDMSNVRAQPDSKTFSIGSGQFSASNITGVKKKVSLDDVKASFALTNSIFDLSSLTSNFYHGTISANAKTNIDTKKLMVFNANAHGVAIGDLLKVMGSEGLTGTADLSLKNIDADLSSKDMPSTLNGDVTMDIKNGSYNRLNFVSFADNLLSGGSLIQPENSSNNTTNFSDMSLTGHITNGIFNNNISLTSPSVIVTGKGDINLSTQNLNYDVNLKKPNNQNSVNLTISGNIQHPVPSILKTVVSSLEKRGLELLQNRFGPQQQPSNGTTPPAQQQSPAGLLQGLFQ